MNKLAMAQQVNVALLVVVTVVAALTINVNAGSHGGARTSRFLMANSGGRGVERYGVNLCLGTGHSCKGVFPLANNTQCCLLPNSKVSVCLDLDYDPVNCGACGKLCGSGYVCCHGTCMSEHNSDDNNCGFCGHKCEHGVHCVLGICGYGHGH